MNEPVVSPTLPLGIEDIARILPHRHPFLLVDRVIELEPGQRIVALKNVTFNEPFFPGHFPDHPVMPGVLIIEALAQAAGVMVKTAQQAQAKPSIFYLVKVDEARFSRTVVPGDQLRLEVEHKRRMRNMSQFAARARVGGEIVAEAQLLCAEVAQP